MKQGLPGYPDFADQCPVHGVRRRATCSNLPNGGCGNACVTARTGSGVERLPAYSGATVPDLHWVPACKRGLVVRPAGAEILERAVAQA